jgi:hypothetical protein
MEYVTMTADWASLKFPQPKETEETDSEERSFVDFPSIDTDVFHQPLPLAKEQKLRTPVILPDNLASPSPDAKDDAYMGIPCYIVNSQHPRYGQKCWIQSSINDTVVAGIPPGCRSYKTEDQGVWGQFSMAEIGIEV